MAIFNINIEDSGTIVNPDDLQVYYGSSSTLPSTQTAVKALPSQNLSIKTIEFILDNNFKNHYIALPFGIILDKIVNVNNLQELITDQYVVKTPEITIDGFQYKIYGLENDVKYINEALHLVNLEGTYNGTVL